MMHKSVYKKYKIIFILLIITFSIFPLIFGFLGYAIYDLACKKEYDKMIISICVTGFIFICYSFFTLCASSVLAEELAEQ